MPSQLYNRLITLQLKLFTKPVQNAQRTKLSKMPTSATTNTFVYKLLQLKLLERENSRLITLQLINEIVRTLHTYIPLTVRIPCRSIRT